jgi:drug/metabolite transporter (DMT)-like permease
LSKSNASRKSKPFQSGQETSLAASDTSALAVLTEPALPIASSHSSKLKTLALVLAVVLLNSVGNVFLAWGMRHIGTQVAVNPLDYIRAMLNPFVASGIVLLILWLLTRMALLSWADLSFVLPLTGLGYILTAVFGKYILSENIPISHWLGTLLIFAGTAMVGATHHHTGPACEARP